MSEITNNRPLKVFLCHAHADRDAVRALYSRLTKDGVDAWLDKEKLLPGQDWELEIRKAVREADVVVVCLSKQFNQAGFRQKEVRLALDTAMEKPEGEIFIIPARLEECDNLESLRKWHWVDLFEGDGFPRLLKSLAICSSQLGRTPLLVGTKNKHFKVIGILEYDAKFDCIFIDENNKLLLTRVQKDFLVFCLQNNSVINEYLDVYCALFKPKIRPKIANSTITVTVAKIKSRVAYLLEIIDPQLIYFEYIDEQRFLFHNPPKVLKPSSQPPQR